MKHTKEAFTWIVNLLRKHKIPFRISGGLAANIYGSERPLADIDIEIPDEEVFEIQDEVKEYITYSPKRYKGTEFDLLLMTLRYKGQEIDVCGADSLRLFNKQNKTWEDEVIDLSDITKKQVYGFIVPVITLEDLITYKKKIARDVDVQDVRALSD